MIEGIATTTIVEELPTRRKKGSEWVEKPFLWTNPTNGVSQPPTKKKDN